MEWIYNNWGMILVLLMVTVGLVDALRNEKAGAKKWLLMACLEAEKLFGSKSGVMKLRYVYDLFVKTFPILSHTMSFEEFSKLVDDVLEEMRHYIDTNMAVFNYVKGED